MCGIIAARLSGAAAPALVEGLARLEYRGYDSAGVALRTAGGGLRVVRTIDRVAQLERLLHGDAAAGTTGIGHTRWATHGGVTERNAHPHRDCSGELAVVHNGIVENALALRAELEERGHRFASDVDSEVIPHLIEEARQHGLGLADAVGAAASRLEGAWAVVVLDAVDGRVVATAHRSPLVLGRSIDGDLLASDIGAIAGRVEAFRALRSGDVVELDPQGSEPRWTHGGRAVAAPLAMPCTVSSEQLDLGEYPDHMAKEIDEQPAVAERVLAELLPGVADGEPWRSLALPAFHRIAVVACGTSLHAGIAIAEVFGRLAGVPSTAVVASEAASTHLEQQTLVLAFSQSGETADVLGAVELLRAPGNPVLAVTNAPHSTLARAADAVLPCHAGPEIGVAATKTFTAQVLTGTCLALAALGSTGRLPRDRVLAAIEDLRRVPELLAQSLRVADRFVPGIAGGLLDAHGFLFLARGAGVVYAAEGALKLKELSYRWAESYPAGELKHGPLALVEAQTPVIVLDGADARLAGNIAEVGARGGRVIRIGGLGADIPALGGSPAPIDAVDWLGPLESVVPLQVLAREIALGLGHDVDKPRNLAKSVTVE